MDLNFTIRVGDLADGTDPELLRLGVERLIRAHVAGEDGTAGTATVVVDSAVESDPNLALWFTPQAIRQHFADDDEDPTLGLTDAQLTEVGYECLTNDSLYAIFHRSLRDALEGERT